MVSFCSLKISLWNACTVLVFFIAGLLSVALRARRPLGAYRIPPETGLLIPSDKRSRRYRNVAQVHKCRVSSHCPFHERQKPFLAGVRNPLKSQGKSLCF